MKKQTLFKNQYLIGIYGPLEEGETLYALLDNAQEFAQLMKINYHNAKVILNHIYNKKNNCIRFFGKLCTVEFINTEELD